MDASIVIDKRPRWAKAHSEGSFVICDERIIVNHLSIPDLDAAFMVAGKTSRSNGPGAAIPRWAVSQGLDPDEIDRLIDEASNNGLSDAAITGVLQRVGCAVSRTTLRRRREFLAGRRIRKQCEREKTTEGAHHL